MVQSRIVEIRGNLIGDNLTKDSGGLIGILSGDCENCYTCGDVSGTGGGMDIAVGGGSFSTKDAKNCYFLGTSKLNGNNYENTEIHGVQKAESVDILLEKLGSGFKKSKDGTKAILNWENQ